MKLVATAEEVRLFREDPVKYSHLLRGKRVDGDLNLSYCTRLTLTSLPEGLTVGGWLDLYGCTSLRSLPEGLTVGGGLSLTDCTSLASLPDDIEVSKDIWLNECDKLIAWLLRNRKVEWLLERVGSRVWGLTSDPLVGRLKR